ncbi:MAG: IS701 family transposase, partial [Pyrinomonadaceae bacterium]
MFVPNKQRVTRLDYCQYLLSSQLNYTLTNTAFHSQQFSHDQLNRFLRDDKLTPRLVWEQVKDSLVASPNAYLLFDDTVADKNYSFAIELVRRQYSG